MSIITSIKSGDNFPGIVKPGGLERTCLWWGERGSTCRSVV